jgi:signal transduction histidine kinase
VGQLAAEHKISVNFELADDLPRISGDWIALDRAMVEILRNGILYTPEDGHVTVSTALDDGQIVVTIHDTGMGIPAVELSRIFDRLYRVEHHRPTGGQGLGLAIAERVVSAHGGRISVESVVGKGSIFRIHLPLDIENQRRL